jgi:cytosine/adenosine deaminase-related metal-dependent hydrolase
LAALWLSGSLEVGKLADVIFVDRNSFETPEREIGEAKAFLALLRCRTVGCWGQGSRSSHGFVNLGR